MPIRRKNSSPCLLQYQLRSCDERADRLKRISDAIDWEKVENILSVLKRGCDATGRPSYDALTLFKGIFLQNLYGFSDEELEFAIADRISLQKFLNIGPLDKLPDATTFCRFRNSLIHFDLANKVHEEILRQMEEKGLELKNGISVDATVIASARRPRKTIENPVQDRNEPDLKENASEEPAAENAAQKNSVGEPAQSPSSQDQVKITYSDDPDAAWTIKWGQPIYGHKAHIGADPVSEIILAGHVTPANRSDMNELQKILEKVKGKVTGMCRADKGYSSAANREIVKKHGLDDGIMEKAIKNRPLTESQKERNRKISSVRSGIERIFGTLKRTFKLNRFKYIGLEKVNQEFMLKVIAYNLMKVSRLYA